MNLYNIDNEPLLWGDDVIKCDKSEPFSEINVLLLERMWMHDFIDKFESHKDKKFVILHKSMEDYFLVSSQEQKKLFDYIKNSENIKVIWDVYNQQIPNFYFHPKAHVQNFYNNSFAFPCDLYLYGNEVFKNQPNKKRIGFHLNGVTDYVRLGLYNELKSHENFFYTINQKNHYNIEKKINTNYVSPIYSNDSVKIGISYEKYIDNFLCQNIKSEMEIVYETHTVGKRNRTCIKWTEKTLKHLYLGKPFIHTDPLSHQLMMENGFLPYTTLYTTELQNLYENITINEVFTDQSFFWKNKLLQNINWLLNMSENEWKDRINEANIIAQRNRNRVFDLIFRTNLYDFIKDLF